MLDIKTRLYIYSFKRLFAFIILFKNNYLKKDALFHVFDVIVLRMGIFWKYIKKNNLVYIYKLINSKNIL